VKDAMWTVDRALYSSYVKPFSIVFVALTTTVRNHFYCSRYRRRRVCMYYSVYLAHVLVVDKMRGKTCRGRTLVMG